MKNNFPNNQFGETLKHLRNSRKLSLRKLAELSGMEFSRLSRIESGDRPPPPASLLLILSKILSCPPALLYQLAGIPLLPLEDMPENCFTGEIRENKEGLALIQSGMFLFQAATPIKNGKVSLYLRAREITLFNLSSDSPHLCSEGSARNQIPGKVTGIIPSSPFCVVEFHAENLSLQALITQQSAEKLELHVGTMVLAVFKVASLFVEVYENCLVR